MMQADGAARAEEFTHQIVMPAHSSVIQAFAAFALQPVEKLMEWITRSSRVKTIEGAGEDESGERSEMTRGAGDDGWEAGMSGCALSDSVFNAGKGFILAKHFKHFENARRYI